MDATSLEEVEETAQTAKDLLRCIEDLREAVSTCSDTEVKSLLSSMVEKASEKAAKLKVLLKPKQHRSVGTQASNNRGEWTKWEGLRDVVETYEDAKKVWQKPWPLDSFRVSVVVGHPLRPKREEDLAALLDAGDRTDRGVGKMLLEHFPFSMATMEQVGVAYMRQTSSVCTEQGGEEHCTEKCVFKARRKEGAEKLEEWFNLLVELKESIVRLGRKTLDVLHPVKEEVQTIRKLLDIVFGRTAVKVTLFVPQATEERLVATTKRKAEPAIPVNPRRKKAKPDGHSTIMVKDDKEFPELLKLVRTTLAKENLGKAEVKSATKRKGGLALEVQGEKDLGKLTEIIQKATGATVSGVRSSDVFLTVRDLDELTTTEEVLDAVKKNFKTAEKDGEMVLQGPLRKTRNSQVATLRVSKDLAKEMLDKGKLKVGLISGCRIREISEKVGCRRCGEAGHFARNCRNQQRCFRCGREGHLSSACEGKETAYCVNCRKEGHTARSARCPIQAKAARLPQPRTERQPGKPAARSRPKARGRR